MKDSNVLRKRNVERNSTSIFKPLGKFELKIFKTGRTCRSIILPKFVCEANNIQIGDKVIALLMPDYKLVIDLLIL